MAKRFISSFLFILFFSASSGLALVREQEYFKTPDDWEFSLGDQKDYFEARLEKFYSAGNIATQSLDYVCGTEHSLQ